MNDEFKFSLVDNNGNSKDYYVIYTFHSDITNKDYMVYTDGTTNEDGSFELLAAAYQKESPEIVLESITTDSEWAIIEDFIKAKLNEEEGD